MKLRKHLATFVRGWLPKEFSLPNHQRIKMIDHFMRLHFLRLTYGVTLAVLLVTPFGVYHSRVEPYITGYLWGYNLPIGYVGLLLGIAAILYPKLNTLRNVRFSSFMPFIGLFLLLSFFFSPKDYFINLIHGTNFSSVQIDVDFAVGNSAVLGLSILSIAFGLVSFIRGWLPKEKSLAYMHKSSKSRWRKPYWIALTLVSVVVLSGFTFLGVNTYLRYSNPAMDTTACYYEKTVNCSTASVGDIVEVNVQVYWHGYVFPEFKRDVTIVDSFPESNFIIINGGNVYESSGYGGSYQLKYLLKVVEGEGVSVELPEPRLYLDNLEVSPEGTSPALKLQNFAESNMRT